MMMRYATLLFVTIYSSITLDHAQITSADNLKALANVPAVSLTLTAQPLEMKLGGSIELKVLLTNLTSGKIWVGREISDVGESNYDVFAVDEKGEEAPDTAYYRHIKGKRLPTDPRFGGTGSRSLELIDSGKALTNRIKLDTVRTLDHAGTYRIWVERLDGISNTHVKSNAVSVTVTQ